MSDKFLINHPIPEPWLSFFAEIEQELKDEVSFHCLGGFVVTMLYGLARSTADVDVVTFVPRTEISKIINLAGKGGQLHKRHQVYLDPVTIVQIPEDYDQRLIEMFPNVFERLRLFALDAYDLALSKIERNTQKDRDDVKHLARVVPFDLLILEKRYHRELRPYLGIPEREDLTLQLWIESIEEERGKSL